MGVSGSGKTTVGRLLADRLGWEFADADDFHSAANVAKMRAGTPLSDADRAAWLRRIAAWIDDRVAAGKDGVVTCSALKRAYRDTLRRPEVAFVYLDGDRDLIARRMAERRGHFFPAALLDSQFRDLEPPGPDERSHTVSIEGEPEETVRRIMSRLDAA
ncbi:MAG TPA: gluconokinase [Streptosporangiaceae bacterium]|nr:gluconokinase [Streptosporangiaceae bacterium]